MNENLGKSIVCTVVSSAYTFGEDVYLKGQVIVVPLEKFDKKQKHLYRIAVFSEIVSGYVNKKISIQDFSDDQRTEFKRMIRAKAAKLKVLIEKQKKEDLELSEDEVVRD